MLVLVIVLVVTNLVSLGALAYLLLRPPTPPRPDAALARVLDGAPPPNRSSSATRRMISVEILNPVELAGTRGRLAGLAGSIAPGLVKRIVYDQTIKTLRRQLAEEGVVADVRMHTVRPPARVAAERRPVPVTPPGAPDAEPSPPTVGSAAGPPTGPERRPEERRREDGRSSADPPPDRPPPAG